MIPTGHIGFDNSPQAVPAEIVLGPDVVTYRRTVRSGQTQRRWVTRPLASLTVIEWDAFPFDPPEQFDEIDFLRQFIANLSPDELEARIEAAIGEEGMHRQGEWVKAALMGMVPQ